MLELKGLQATINLLKPQTMQTMHIEIMHKISSRSNSFFPPTTTSKIKINVFFSYDNVEKLSP